MYIPFWLIILIIIGLSYYIEMYNAGRDENAEEIKELKNRLEDLEERMTKIESPKREVLYWESPSDKTENPDPSPAMQDFFKFEDNLAEKNKTEK